MRVVLPLLVVSLFLAAKVEAQGGTAAADAAYGAGELTEAERLYTVVLEAGSHNAATVAHIYLRLGVLRASRGELSGAEQAFSYALAIDHLTGAPEELSPALREPFDRASASRPSEGAPGLALRVRSVGHGDPTVLITVEWSPPGLAHSVQYPVTEAGVRRWETVPVGTEPLEVERGPSPTMEVRLLDQYGSVLDTSVFRLPSTTTIVDGSGAGDDGGILKSPWFWVTVGLVVAAGTTAGVLWATADDEFNVGAPIVR